MRGNLKDIQDAIKKINEDVLNTYPDKKNIYYLAIEENQNFILDFSSRFSVNYHYNEKELLAFVQYVNTLTINSVSKSKEVFASNIDNILTRSVYSSEVVTLLFEKFGWNV